MGVSARAEFHRSLRNSKKVKQDLTGFTSVFSGVAQCSKKSKHPLESGHNITCDSIVYATQKSVYHKGE